MKSFTVYLYIINREKNIQYSEDQVNPGQKYTVNGAEMTWKFLCGEFVINIL